jgi:hypothetical protein
MSRQGFRGIERYTKRVEKLSDQKLHEVTNEAFAEFEQRSPVDTGMFRLNWLGSVGTPNTSTHNNTQKVAAGSRPNGAELANLAPALSAKLGKDVYITNNVKYAGKLENGHSKQAPAGVLHVGTAAVAARGRR